MIGIERRGSKAKLAPVLNRVTATSSATAAGSSRRTTVAVQSDAVPVSSTSRCGSTARRAAWSGRTLPGPQSVIQPPSSCAGLVLTEMLFRVTITPGMEKRVRALPYVAGLWGQSAADAAAPILDLIQGDRDDHRDLTTATVVGRGLRSVLAGNLRRSRRMQMQVETLR